MAAELKDRLSAISVSDDGDASIAALRAVVFAEGSDAESIKVKESALDRLTAALVTRKDAQGLSTLLDELRPLFATVPKAKTAKIVRNVVAAIARIPDTDDLLVREPGERENGGGERTGGRLGERERERGPSFAFLFFFSFFFPLPVPLSVIPFVGVTSVFSLSRCFA